MPRFRRKARIWLGDLHRLAALWSIWFVLLMALTGIWYLAERSFGGAAPPFPAPEAPKPRDLVMPMGYAGRDLDRAVAVTVERMPDLEIRMVLFPLTPSHSLSMRGQASAVLVRPRANAVLVDPTDSALVGAHRGEDLEIHQRISEMADPLHFGTFGGFATKVLWFLFGVLMSGLAVTGVCIYGKRLAAPTSRVARGAGAEERGLPNELAPRRAPTMA